MVAGIIQRSSPPRAQNTAVRLLPAASLQSWIRLSSWPTLQEENGLPHFGHVFASLDTWLPQSGQGRRLGLLTPLGPDVSTVAASFRRGG